MFAQRPRLQTLHLQFKLRDAALYRARTVLIFLSPFRALVDVLLRLLRQAVALVTASLREVKNDAPKLVQGKFVVKAMGPQGVEQRLLGRRKRRGAQARQPALAQAGVELGEHFMALLGRVSSLITGRKQPLELKKEEQLTLPSGPAPQLAAV